ncbi:LOW QUALITY PROTEIN: protein mono-ADP-ribosyltransferase PARP14-like [Argopecten irradians]|uniref:LOW QUALITY PROTEIN: protein mono-ADP-ribosyltransferase PARP14-like n=1 Tax=Argopecten irradians TaxID=31199 RepID=UPI003710CAAB
MAKKTSVDNQNTATQQNEKMLWHGTAADTVNSINLHGFNRSYCGKNVVDRVLERSHTVDNTTLDVKLFHELLGESGDDGPKFKVPDTLVISDIDPRKVQFLQNSKPNKDGLEKQLSSQHTQIIWPENLGDPVKLECLLTKEIKDCRTLAKAWKDTARLALDRFLDVLSVFKHDILQEAWGSVIGELQNMNISHPDGVSVAVEKVSYEIFVMGHKKFAAEVSQSVEKIIKVIVDELERKKKQISETTRALKHYQVMMLSKTNYKETVEKKYRGMKVILDFKGRTVTYEGLYGEVNEAKANLFETISALVSSEVNDFSKGKYKYLQEKAVKTYVAGKMKDKNITAVWEMQNSKFLVFAMSDEGAVNAAHILKDSILETSVDVKKESLPLLATEKWSDEEQNIKGACTVLVYISVLRDKPCILIYATDVDAEMVRERVSDFLINNTIYDTKLPLGTGIIRFLQSHCVREIQDIEQRHKLDQVTININNLGLEIKGTEVGLSKAKQDVNAVISQVARKEHVLRKPGITKLMTSEDSKPKVSQVEKIHRVVIVPSDESDDDVTGAGPMPLRPDHTQEMARCSQPGYELMVVMGDITNLKVDVLVNAANRELQHNGGLAKAIVQKGGNAIQDDCNRYIRQHRALMEGDVYMGKAGSLQCNYIAHAVGPKWQGGRQREKELLTEAVLKCLEETNIYQQTSIALPALGAGVFGYPAAKSTQTIVDAIDEFFKDNPRNTIQNIYLCDVSQNNVDLFVKALQKVYGQMSVIIADATGGARDKWSAQKAKPRKGWKNVTPEPDMPPSYPEAPVEINITITLVKGQIANQKVDMIVNTCSKDLKLSNGAVSSSLLAAAGPQMQAECDQNYQGIQFGEIAVTQGYNLQCHCVCHGSLPGWDGGASALVVLQKFMLACLREATQQGYESVAFPAMGTGNLSYPRDTVAREMYKIVSKYSTQNPTSPVRNVMFVIYDKDLPTVKAFEDAEKSQGKAHNLHGQVRNRHTRKFGNKSQEDKGHSYHQGNLAMGRFLSRHSASAEELDDTAMIKPPSQLHNLPTAPQIYPHGPSFYVDADASSEDDEMIMRPLHHTQSEILPRNLDKGAPTVAYHHSKSYPEILEHKMANNILSPRYRLEDTEIDKAMRIIKKQCPYIGGLQDASVVALASVQNISDKFQGDFIQICHTGHNHWVTITNLQCQRSKGHVKVYDSFYRNPTSRLILDLTSLIKPKPLSFTLELPMYQKQNFKGDCGLFAIAAMVSLANGNDPSDIVWNCSKMRGHLVECISLDKFTEFPVSRDNKDAIPDENFLEQKVFHIYLCVSCRQALLKRDTQVKCGHCGERCHDRKDCVDDDKLCGQCMFHQMTSKAHGRLVRSSYPKGTTSIATSFDPDSYQEVVVEIGNVKLKIYQGDITQAKVDAIVNGTNAEFDLKRGKVSNAILKMGGGNLKKQVKQLGKEMKNHGIAVTSNDSSFGMQCDNIIHIDAEERRGSGWKTKFLIAMEKAEERKFSSVAFPALGTGVGSKPEEIADSFVDALVEFIDQNPMDIKEIHMVIFDKPMLQQFLIAMQTSFQHHEQKQTKSSLGQKVSNFFGRWASGKPSQGPKLQWDPKFNVISQDKSQFPITVYGPDQTTISSAIDSLETLLEKNFRDKVFSDDIIRNFTNSQEKKVHELGSLYDVEVKVDKRLGRVRLIGLLENITDASDDLNKMIRVCEKKKMQEKEAELIGDMVQWHFIEVTAIGEKLQAYPPDINLQLEKKYRDQKSQAEFNDSAGNVYVVDFTSLEEFPENDPTDRVKVMRKNKMADTTLEIPADWSAMADKDNLSVVVLQPTDYNVYYNPATVSGLGWGTYFDPDIHERTSSKSHWQELGLRTTVLCTCLSKSSHRKAREGADLKGGLFEPTKFGSAGVGMELLAPYNNSAEWSGNAYADARGDQSLSSYNPITGGPNGALGKMSALMLYLLMTVAYDEKTDMAPFRDDEWIGFRLTRSTRTFSHLYLQSDIFIRLGVDERECSLFIDVAKDYLAISVHPHLVEVDTKVRNNGVLQLCGKYRCAQFETGNRWRLRTSLSSWLRYDYLEELGAEVIERIQNRTLYQQYVAKKKLVDIQNGTTQQNEKMLWHGTAAETVGSINAHGFNRSYCGKNATAFGDGVYFAVNASYSASNTYSRPDPSGHKRMYLCKVITGEFTQGSRGMRVAPPKGTGHLLFDSVVDTPANPGMYIIFNDTQAYPEYLITFQ